MQVEVNLLIYSSAVVEEIRICHFKLRLIRKIWLHTGTVVKENPGLIPWIFSAWGFGNFHLCALNVVACKTVKTPFGCPVLRLQLCAAAHPFHTQK